MMVDAPEMSLRCEASEMVRSPDSPNGWQKTTAPSGSDTLKPVLVCRSMTEQDIEPAIRLLSAGFPAKEPDHWRRGLQRLRDRAVPEGRPRYGYVMTDSDRLVGIILLIFSETESGTIRGNVSSWYVEPAYRGFSNLLLARPLKLKGVMLFNISPSPDTIETIHAQGFSRYVGGTLQALAVLAPPVSGARVRQVAAGDQDTLPILVDHAAWGCLSYEILHRGETHPFVFVPSRFFGGRFPCAQLIYCRELGDFVRFAGPLGRRLLRHGLPAVMVDANGPLAGLPGLYRAGRGQRFYSGVARPGIGDLSYTELAIFGP